MTDNILIITPPDKIFNQSKNCCLIYPDSGTKQKIQNIVARSNESQNIYVYEREDQNHDIDWLLTAVNISSIVIINLDECALEIKKLASYIISLPQTFWMTNSENTVFSKLSPNKVYNLDSIEHLIGGNIESKSKEEQ